MGFAFNIGDALNPQTRSESNVTGLPEDFAPLPPKVKTKTLKVEGIGSIKVPDGLSKEQYIAIANDFEKKHLNMFQQAGLAAAVQVPNIVGGLAKLGSVAADYSVPDFIENNMAENAKNLGLPETLQLPFNKLAAKPLDALSSKMEEYSKNIRDYADKGYAPITSPLVEFPKFEDPRGSGVKTFANRISDMASGLTSPEGIGTAASILGGAGLGKVGGTVGNVIGTANKAQGLSMLPGIGSALKTGVTDIGEGLATASPERVGAGVGELVGNLAMMKGFELVGALPKILGNKFKGGTPQEIRSTEPPQTTYEDYSSPEVVEQAAQHVVAPEVPVQPPVPKVPLPEPVQMQASQVAEMPQIPPQIMPEAPVLPENLSVPQAPQRSAPKLPKQLNGAKPRYSYGSKQYQLEFGSDVDKAAYITAQKTPSKADAQYRSFLEQQGMTPEEIQQHGQIVRDHIKEMAKAGNPSAGPLKIDEVTRTKSGGQLSAISDPFSTLAEFTRTIKDQIAKRSKATKEFSEQKPAEGEEPFMVGETTAELNRKLYKQAQMSAAQKVDQMIEDGKIVVPEGQTADYLVDKMKNEVANQEYLRMSEDAGISSTAKGGNAKKLGFFTQVMGNATNIFGRLDEQVGTNTAAVIREMGKAYNEQTHLSAAAKRLIERPVNNLKKLGVTGEQINRIMQHMESMPNGKVRFNRDALNVLGENGRVKRSTPKWEGPMPSKPILDEAFNLRKAFDKWHTDYNQWAVKNGKPEIPYSSRYTPTRGLIPGEHGGTEASAVSPSFTKQKSGYDEPLNENLYENIDRYVGQFTKQKAYSKVIPELKAALDQLDAKGLGLHRDALKLIAENSIGYGGNGVHPVARAKLLKLAKEQGTVAVREEMSRLGITPTKTEAFMRELNSQFVHAALGLSPNFMLTNPLQALIEGPAELGIKTTAKMVFRRLTAADKKILEELGPKLQPEHYDPFGQGEGVTDLTGKAAKISKALKAPGTPGMKWVEYTDKLQRGRITIAGYHQLKDATPAGRVKLLNDLNPYERQAVRDAYRAGGIEAAAKEFGIIKQELIMRRMNPVDKPVGMHKPVGKNFMFTSHWRGVLNNSLDDIHHGRYKKLAKKMAYPLVLATLYGALGGDAAKLYPYGSILPGMGNMKVAPVLSIAGDALKSGTLKGAVKAVAGITAATKLPAKILLKGRR